MYYDKVWSHDETLIFIIKFSLFVKTSFRRYLIWLVSFSAFQKYKYKYKYVQILDDFLPICDII